MNGLLKLANVWEGEIFLDYIMTFKEPGVGVFIVIF